MNKIAFIVSTGGSILSKLLEHELVVENTDIVVSDRECGAIELSRRLGIRNEVLPAQSGDQFSNLLSQKFFGRDIVFILFYTKLLTEPFLSAHSRRIFNCHPSILPSCKGLDGFGDTLSSNSLFMGCTLHEVDSGVDTGMSVIQAAIPLNRRLDMSQNRQKIFLAQYYSTLQFIRWTTSDRINSANNWQLEEARYEPGVFSPNLDSDFFDYFKIKNELRQYPMQKD